MKEFNTTGVCIPEMHYMVDIRGKIVKIMKLVENGKYFTINRARQYGKTTTLFMLTRLLPEEYTCINLSFEGMGDTMFKNPEMFCQRILWKISKELNLIDKSYGEKWKDSNITDFDLLAHKISTLASGKKLILIIDEVDKTSNSRVFLQFLGMLRNLFLNRTKISTFQSVILAGVHDIKNIKLKIKKEGLYSSPEDQERLYNSPWNIAANFNVDMSFSPDEIATMLEAYEADHSTNMCVEIISHELHKYTNGYPYLVSRLCQLIDEDLSSNWTISGVQEAVKIIMSEKNTLFDELFKNLANNPEINELMYAVLVQGNKRARSRRSQSVEWSEMFGYLSVERTGELSISNKIFEGILIDHFITEEAMAAPANKEVCNTLRSNIIVDGIFSMELCLRKFAEFYNSVYSEEDIPALERHARLIFLAYLHPLVNGYGFYHIESQFTDSRRMDVVLDYGTNQYIIELKLWYGEAAHERAFSQLLGYMDTKNTDKGYLLTFDLRLKKNRQPKAEWISISDKKIFNVVV